MEHLQKTKEEWKNLKKWEIQNIFTEMNQGKVYGDFKDLARGTVSGKVLRDKAFNIAKTPKYDSYERGLAFMVFKVFEKKPSDGGVNTKTKKNQQLVDELLKKEVFINLLKTIFGVLIQLICN